MGPALHVRIGEGATPDGAAAKDALASIAQAAADRERHHLLVDGASLRRGTLDWTQRLTGFLTENRSASA